MRIAIMLRAYDRPGGIGIYARNIVKHLLRIDGENEYLLIYNNKNHVGTYGDRPNVSETHIAPGNPIVWDQWAVPRALRRWGADLVFNTKFSVPLATRIKRVMVLHGASWFVHPELYGKLDIFYVNRAMPVYCRAADFLISNSDLTTRDFIRLLKVPPDKVRTVNLAAGEAFKPVVDPERLAHVRDRYGLPERYVLTVTSYDPRKNFETLLKVVRRSREQEDVHLVVAGKDCDRYRGDYDFSGNGLERAVHFLGWVDQQDLPGLYSAADAFVFPSVYEEFGIPVVEALSCGCPVVSSSTGAIPSLVGEAGLLCDPFDDETMARNLVRILSSEAERDRFRQDGLKRAELFSWDKAARATLEILETVARAD